MEFVRTYSNILVEPLISTCSRSGSTLPAGHGLGPAGAFRRTLREVWLVGQTMRLWSLMLKFYVWSQYLSLDHEPFCGTICRKAKIRHIYAYIYTAS